MQPDLPHAWATAIRTVLETATRTLVLGPADSGKSTLCRLLLEQARGAGRSVAILDPDLGQKLIGPPACLTLGTLTRQGPVLRGLAFAGTTDPVAAGSLLLAGAVRLAACAATDLLIVNTCGYFKDRGLTVKQAAKVATAADTLLVLGQDPAGAALLSSATERTVLCLPAAPEVARGAPGSAPSGLRDLLRRQPADSPAPWCRLRPDTLIGPHAGTPRRPRRSGWDGPGDRRARRCRRHAWWGLAAHAPAAVRDRRDPARGPGAGRGLRRTAR